MHMCVIDIPSFLSLCLDFWFCPTQVPKETSRLVAGVRQLHDAIPTVIRPIVQALDGVSRECVRLVEEKRHVSTESLPVPHPWHGLSSEEETAASATGTVWSADDDRADSSEGQEEKRRGATVAEPWIAPAAFVRKFGELVRISHNLLNALGVGHPALDRVVRTAKEFGAAAKLTGAGGGGCAFCVIPPPEEDSANDGDATPGARHPVSAELDTGALKAQLNEQGCDCFETNLGGWGVLVRGVDV